MTARPADAGRLRRAFEPVRLANLREGKRLSHMELALRLYDHTGRTYHPVRLGRFERGLATPTINDALALSEVLDCAVEDLCGQAPPKGSPPPAPAGRGPGRPRRSGRERP